MSEVQSTRRIESSPVLSPGGELLLEHAFKLHKGSTTVFDNQKSSFPKGQLPGIFRTAESITNNPVSLNILIGNPRLLTIVSQFPALLNILISNPTLLTILETNPSLIFLAITNPDFLVLLAKRPILLRLVAANPKLIFLLTENLDLLTLLRTKPSLLAMLGKNPELLATVIAKPELLSKQRSIKESQKKIIIDENKLIKGFLQRAVLASKALTNLAREILLLLSRTFTMVKTPLTILTSQRKVAVFKPVRVLPLVNKLSLNTVVTSNTQALNPALLAQLGAAAVTTNKGRVSSSAGNPEDWGVEQETQSEKQLRTLEEIGQIKGVEEAQEPKLVR